MNIKYDKEKSQFFTNQILNKFDERNKTSKRGTALHVSDLTGCLMKPYCRIIGVEQEPFDDTLKGIMVYGIVAEEVIGWGYSKDAFQYAASTAISTEDFTDCISGHVDIMELKDGKKYPIEVKSTRKNVLTKKDIPIHWLEQLLSYMAMHDANTGWIVFYSILATSIIAFRVDVTDKDNQEWIAVLQKRAKSIRVAQKTGNPENIEIRPENYPYCGYKHGCPRVEECRDKHQEMLKQKQEKRNQQKEKSGPLD